MQQSYGTDRILVKKLGTRVLNWLGTVLISPQVNTIYVSRPELATLTKLSPAMHVGKCLFRLQTLIYC